MERNSEQKKVSKQMINTSLIFIYELVNMLERRYSVYYNERKISLGRHTNGKIETIGGRHE